ncbi:hypothetical protein NFI96_020782, partial [Prochilodus magdalenae]
MVTSCGLALFGVSLFVSWKLFWVPWRDRCLPGFLKDHQGEQQPVLTEEELMEREYSTDFAKDSSGPVLLPESAMKISHTSPDIQLEAQTKAREHNHVHIARVQRQVTEPTSSVRHNSIRRQMNLSNPDFNPAQFQRQESLSGPGLGRIKPELYKQRSVDTDDGRRSDSCGLLHFILKYDCDLEQLIVKIHKAEDLPAKDFSGTSDPYVKIYLLPERKTKHQTKVHRKTLNPVFDEVFLFPVAYAELNTRKLHFSVYDFDRFSRHDLIGQVVVDNFLDLPDFPRETKLCRDILYVTALEHPHTVPADGAVGVEVKGHQVFWTCDDKPFILVLTTVPPHTDSLGVSTKTKAGLDNVDLGDLMFSLCYLPTAGRLTITIIKARNLKAMDITGASDPYVKVSLMCDGRRLKKRKTSTKRNTLNPIYNEAIVFDVPPENIDQISLLIAVMDYDRNTVHCPISTPPTVPYQHRPLSHINTAHCPISTPPTVPYQLHPMSHINTAHCPISTPPTVPYQHRPLSRINTAHCPISTPPTVPYQHRPLSHINTVHCPISTPSTVPYQHRPLSHSNSIHCPISTPPTVPYQHRPLSHINTVHCPISTPSTVPYQHRPLSHINTVHCPISTPVGHNEIIGVCRVGNTAESLGRDHWNEMLTYPRKPIAHWHPLI